jgi:hypothetical protein
MYMLRGVSAVSVSLLIPCLLTMLLYALAVLFVVSTRRGTSAPPGPPPRQRRAPSRRRQAIPPAVPATPSGPATPRPRPVLRVLPGGLAASDGAPARDRVQREAGTVGRPK